MNPPQGMQIPSHGKSFSTLSRPFVFFLIFTLFAGCAGPEYMLGGSKETLLSSTSPVSKSEISSERFSLSRLSVDQDDVRGTFTIRGVVVVTYRQHEWEEWAETYEVVHYGAYGIQFDPAYRYTRTKKQNERWKDDSIVPNQVSIHIGDFGTTARVDAYGHFVTEPISMPDTRRPNDSKYHNIRPVTSSLSCRFSCTPMIAGRSKDLAEQQSISITRFRIEANFTAVDEFVATLPIHDAIFPLTVAFRDGNTHLSISANSEVRAVAVPDLRADAMVTIRKEFSGELLSAELIRYAEQKLPEYMPTGERAERAGQAVVFRAVEGGTYRIQTFEPNYYHEDVTLTARKREPNKALLLTETGQKVRVDLSKEGRGALIDN